MFICGNLIKGGSFYVMPGFLPCGSQNKCQINRNKAKEAERRRIKYYHVPPQIIFNHFFYLYIFEGL